LRQAFHLQEKTMSIVKTCPTPASAMHIAIVGTIFSFVWSSAFIAGKVGMTSTGPLTLLSLRFLLAGLLLAVIGRMLAAPISAPRFNRTAILAALAAGLLTNAVYLGLTYTGMRTVPAGLTAILVSTSPLLASPFAALWLKEPFGWRGALGLVAGFAGVVWIMGGRAMSAPADITGVLLILIGTVALAASTLLNRHAVTHLDPRSIAMIQLPASGLVLLPLAWWREGLAIRPDMAFFGSLAYQATVVSIGTTLMLLWLVRHGGAARASGFHLLNPAFGTLLAATILGETVPASDLLGVVPIVAGLALVLWPGRLQKT
jgi:drug/metabolite transporter (DMT)-like permease